jgi:hypothetical protein
MKKLLLVLLIGLISLCSYSQKFNKVVQCRYTIYDYAISDWKIVDINYPDNMFIIIKNKEITITNKSESAYKIYGEPKEREYETHSAMEWGAYDKDGNPCAFMVKMSKSNKDTMWMYFIYDGYSFDYEIEINEDSGF